MTDEFEILMKHPAKWFVNRVTAYGLFVLGALFGFLVGGYLCTVHPGFAETTWQCNNKCDTVPGGEARAECYLGCKP